MVPQKHVQVQIDEHVFDLPLENVVFSSCDTGVHEGLLMHVTFVLTSFP